MIASPANAFIYCPKKLGRHKFDCQQGKKFPTSPIIFLIHALQMQRLLYLVTVTKVWADI